MADEKLTSPPGDRRVYERLKKEFRMDYSLFDDFALGRAGKSGRLLDIGGGGLCFLTSEPLEEQVSLVVLLDLLGWNPVMDEWVREQDEYDLGPLQVLCTVVRVSECRHNPGNFEVAVRFSGQIK